MFSNKAVLRKTLGLESFLNKDAVLQPVQLFFVDDSYEWMQKLMWMLKLNLRLKKKVLG